MPTGAGFSNIQVELFNCLPMKLNMFFKKHFLDFLFKVSGNNVTCYHVTPTMRLMPKAIKKIEISSEKSVTHLWAAETKKLFKEKHKKRYKRDQNDL